MEADGRFDSGKFGEGLIFIITNGSKYRESLGISCFQGFLAIYRYKEKVARVYDFIRYPCFVKC